MSKRFAISKRPFDFGKFQFSANGIGARRNQRGVALFVRRNCDDAWPWLHRRSSRYDDFAFAIIQIVIHQNRVETFVLQRF